MVSGFKIFQKAKSQNHPPKGVIFIEQWKLIESAPSYEVSSLGRVRNFKTKKIIAQRINRSGYYQSNLYKEGKKITREIHRLVALAFLPNEENKPFVNHKNGIKTDNRVENLEWCTQAENITHAVKNRLVKTKLTDEQAKEIFNSQLSHRKLAKLYNITNSIVWRIKNKKAYKHLW